MAFRELTRARPQDIPATMPASASAGHALRHARGIHPNNRTTPFGCGNLPGHPQGMIAGESACMVVIPSDMTKQEADEGPASGRAFRVWRPEKGR